MVPNFRLQSLPVVLPLVLLLGAPGAAHAQLVPVERSVAINADPDLVWLQAGGYCALSKWDGEFKRCDVVLGTGAPGTVRRMVYKAGGLPAVDILTDKGPYAYSYRKLSGHTRGRLQARPGRDAGTTILTWQVWLDPFALPDGAGSEYPYALGDSMQAALGNLKVRAEEMALEAAKEAAGEAAKAQGAPMAVSPAPERLGGD